MRFQGENDDERDRQDDPSPFGGPPNGGITTKGDDVGGPNTPGEDILNPGGNSETPRERPAGPEGGATPPMSNTPRPAEASVASSGGGGDMARLRPFAPMPTGPSGQPQPTGAIGQPPVGQPSGPIGQPFGGASRLFGSLGGLKGGGRGVMSSTVNPNAGGSPEIAQLIATLQRRKGLF